MPHKGGYRAHFEDEYDEFDDYGYDSADELPESGRTLQGTDANAMSRQEVAVIGWSCPICTYYNEDSFTACDICGVLRNPLVKPSSRSDSSEDDPHALDGMWKDARASLMAKSLFASCLPQPAKKSFFAVQQDSSSKDDTAIFHKLGISNGSFREIHKAFSSQNKQKVHIDPFKFDVPSPDDLVSNGLKGVRLKSSDNLSTKRERIAPMESKLAAKDHHSGLAEDDSELVSGRKTFSASNGGKPKPSHSGRGKAKTDLEKKSTSANLNKQKTAEKREGVSNQLNLAVVGHVDSGKSTLSGRLLHLLGRISQKEMHKYAEEAKQHGKGSFAYAWAMDESPEERDRGITMTVGVAFLKSRKYDVVLLDSPGHRDLVPNMISGATQADAAILVVDGSMGSFEGGMDASRGQTREHAQLIRSFGVDQVIVVVNKMDVVEYSKERYNAITQKLGTFLRSCGYKDSSVTYIPASAMENQNLIEKPSDARLSWFEGPSLLEAIDSIQLPVRDYSKSLLMPVCDVIKLESQNQVSACGKLESGTISAGDKVLVLPSKERAKVQSLSRDSHPCDVARAGDNVTVILQGIDMNHVAGGGVICHPDFPVKVSSCLELKILVLDISTPILMGSQVEFHIHHAKTAARVSRILSVLDPKTGAVTKKSPRCLVSKQNAIIEVILDEAVCVEEYSKCRALGRVFLRASGRTIAMGIVTQVTESEW